MTSGVPELWLAMRADFNPFLEKAFAELNRMRHFYQIGILNILPGNTDSLPRV